MVLRIGFGKMDQVVLQPPKLLRGGEGEELCLRNQTHSPQNRFLPFGLGPDTVLIQVILPMLLNTIPTWLHVDRVSVNDLRCTSVVTVPRKIILNAVYPTPHPRH